MESQTPSLPQPNEAVNVRVDFESGLREAIERFLTETFAVIQKWNKGEPLTEEEKRRLKWYQSEATLVHSFPAEYGKSVDGPPKELPSPEKLREWMLHRMHWLEFIVFQTVDSVQNAVTNILFFQNDDPTEQPFRNPAAQKPKVQARQYGDPFIDFHNQSEAYKNQAKSERRGARCYIHLCR